MISAEQLIGDLLLRHNCVIIPSFGGFVANQVSAVVDYRSGVMMPPKKSLLFNRQLVNNDGLLISELSVQNGINYSDAQSEITSLVVQWNDKLKNGERVHLDRIGHLYFDQEKNICFEQDRFFNLLLQSYGLSKVHFITESDINLMNEDKISPKTSQEAPIKRIDFTQIEEEKKEESNSIMHPASKKHTKAWRYLAAACLLPIGFYSFWIPMKTNVLESGMLSIKDFNPFYHSTDGSYDSKSLNVVKGVVPDMSLEEMISDLPEDIYVFSYPFDNDLYIPVRIKDLSEQTNSTTSVNEEVAPVSTNGNFHFIVGCFGDINNATKLVRKLKSSGLDASLAGETNGLTRVSAGNANSEAELQTIISRSESLGFKGWVFKK